MSDRRAQILKYASPGLRGIEVAPYFNPLAPKSQGWNVLVLDIADATALRERASRDPLIPAENIAHIEAVDIVGSATEIAELVGESGFASFDFVVSSHNFEHLPDPIRFFQGVAKILKPGGFLSMAIPDKRACFDVFRRRTSLSDWLGAYRERRQAPTPEQIFDCESHYAHFQSPTPAIAWLLGDDVSNTAIRRELSNVFEDYKRHLDPVGVSAYTDTHCSVLTPATFRLLVEELGYLQLIDMRLLDVVETGGGEFFVHLKRVDHCAEPALSPDVFAMYRHQLLLMCLNEL